MIYTDLLPYVMPDAVKCPNVIALQRIKMACIEFFERTKVWNGTYTTSTVQDQPSITIALSTDITAIDLESVYVGDDQQDEYQIVSADTAQELAASMYSAPYAWRPYLWSSTPFVFNLSPTPGASGIPVQFTISQKPSLTSQGIAAGAYFDQFYEGMAAGALAKILMMPGKDWTDRQLAELKQAQFNDAIQTAVIRAARGFGGGRLRTRAYYF